MTIQSLPNLVYVVIVLIALLTPYLRPAPGRQPDRTVVILLVGCALILTLLRQGVFAILDLVLLLTLIGVAWIELLGCTAALLFFLPVDWWTPNVNFAAAGATLLAARLLGRQSFALAAETTSRSIAMPMAVAAAVGLAVGLLTAPFGSREAIYFAWHHWGAYLSPVEAWLAGGLPYRDFPVQYGLGPTAVLASVCSGDCWRAMYATTICANALYFAVLVGCVMVITHGRPRAHRWLALAALFCATFIWTAYPVDVGSAAMTPSVAGLRFLPIAALLLQIVSAEANGRRRDWLGHITWLFAILWSPEAAFFGTLIWWPYLALRDAADAGSSRERWAVLLRGIARGTLALVGALLVLATLLWILSAGRARPDDFLAYVLHPPGPLPINPLGTVWLALACVALAALALPAAASSSRGRTLYACLLGFLAAATYFLSRSHDNNVLNLFPMLVVLLVATIGVETSDARVSLFRQAFVRTILTAMVVFTATVGGASWAAGAANDGILNIGPSKLIARFDAMGATRPQMIPDDASRAIAALRGRGAGAIVLLDHNKLMPRHAAGQAWTGVNNVANFEPLPRTLIIRSVCRGAMAYRRAGWLLVDRRQYAGWVDMFAAGYSVGEQDDFGSYRAYRMVPRPGPLACAEL